jgi:signal transduction histidine kinase
MNSTINDLQSQIRELAIAAHRREIEIVTIREIGKSLSNTLDRDKLLPTIMAEMTRLMGAERSTLYIYDKENQELWSKVLLGDGLKEIRLHVGHGIAGWVAEHREAVLIKDAYDDDRFNPEFDKKSGFRTRSILCIPVMDPENAEDIIGVIQVLNKTSGHFGNEDLGLLEVIATQVAIGLKNSELYSKLQNKAAEINLLYQLERLFSEAEKLEDIFDRAIELISQSLQAEAGSIILHTSNKDFLYFKAAYGEKSAAIKQLRLPKDKGIVGWVVKNDEPLIVNSPAEDSRFNPDIAEKIDFPARSIICFPLRINNKVVGAVEIINKLDGDFGKSDLILLELISGQIARAVEIVELRMKKQREDRFVTLGNVMSSVLHDMRTPVNNIHGFVSLLQTPDTSEEEREEFIGIIKNQIDSVLSMTREILDFAKGKTEILPRKISAQAFIKDIVKEFEFMVQRKKHELVVGEIAPIWLAIDPEKIRRVLQNLVKNAIEAMHDPGIVKLILERTDDNMAKLTVADTGPGIPDEIRNTAFESFATFGKENGTGLGLAIVKKIISQHNGRIQFESGPEGTAFFIYLPVSQD